MNNKKIAFIISVNNETYFEECNWYLNRLILPEDFEIDVITVREAKSMAEAYNAAMESSDAKYKVYMHQDVFIINQNIISDMVDVFKADDKIGMLGLIGGVNLPKDGIIYNVWNCGRTIACDFSLAVDTRFYQRKPYISVEALDGMFLATQYDIRWRDDILKQWDFYDISQSFEFRKAGYHIVIPYQDIAWTYHDCGYSNLMHYDENRKIMFNAYPEYFGGKWGKYPFKYNYELQLLTNQLYVDIKNLINQGRYKEAEILLNGFDENGMVKNMPILRQIFATVEMEKELLKGPTLLDHSFLTSELFERYTKIKFFLRRLDIGEKTKIEYILNWIHVNEVSPIEIIIGIVHNLINYKQVKEVIIKAYRLGGEVRNSTIMEVILSKYEKWYISVIKDSDEYIGKRRIDVDNWLNIKEN